MPTLGYFKTVGNIFKHTFETTNTKLIAFGVIKWTILLTTLTALAQTYGFSNAFGIYIGLAILSTSIQLFIRQDKPLNEQTTVTQPTITQTQSEDEHTVTITVKETDPTGTVILAIPGETDIADYHGTNRELEAGDSATLKHNTKDDEITIKTKTKTETLPASETQINLFEHDYILFEYYKNTQPTRQHINYGDI